MTCVHLLLHLGNSSALKAFFFFFFSYFRVHKQGIVSRIKSSKSYSQKYLNWLYRTNQENQSFKNISHFNSLDVCIHCELISRYNANQRVLYSALKQKRQISAYREVKSRIARYCRRWLDNCPNMSNLQNRVLNLETISVKRLAHIFLHMSYTCHEIKQPCWQDCRKMVLRYKIPCPRNCIENFAKCLHFQAWEKLKIRGKLEYNEDNTGF